MTNHPWRASLRVWNAYQIGIANRGPLFLTLPTILSTAQIFNASSEQGLSTCGSDNDSPNVLMGAIIP